ncbi:MAG: trigger factor [Bacteroidetes bacterium]|nr:trigger factor [Bacteroidota bacterium]
MASVTKENIGNLHDKLIVKISKEDYLPFFEKSVKDFSKKANIPGFRKGMVPAGMIKKMYGPSLYYDEVIKSVEKQLNQYLTEEKPEIFAQPLPLQADMASMNMNNPVDYEFPFEIGYKPEISLDFIGNLKPTLYKVEATPEMVNEEIEKMLTKSATLKEVDTVTTPENILAVSFTSSDEVAGAEAEGESNQVEITVKDFKNADEILNKQQGAIIEIIPEQAFVEDRSEEIIASFNLKAGEGKKYEMKLEKISIPEKKELNEEFFKLVFPEKEIKIEADFRKVLQEEIQIQWDKAGNEQIHDQFYHAMLDVSINLPEAFLKNWIAKGGEKEKSAEEVESQLPKFLDQLKYQLISDKIIKDNDLNVTQDEIRLNIQNQVMGYFGGMAPQGDLSWLDSYIDRMMKDEKQVESTYHKVITDKIFNWLDTQVKPTEKTISAEEFVKLQHHHH